MSLSSVFRYRKKFIMIIPVAVVLVLYIIKNDVLIHVVSEEPQYVKNTEEIELSAGSYVKFDANKISQLGNVEKSKDYRIPTLRQKPEEVPVIVVDEHQEVIPYWYKAVEENIIRSQANTLIHIDGHSDMAPPERYEALSKFQYKHNSPESVFLPLMTSNDVFIISAIITGLIKNVIWVRPSWLHESSQTRTYTSYAGVFTNKTTGKKYVCECEMLYTKTRTRPYECLRMNTEPEESQEEEEERGDISMPHTECKLLKKFNLFFVSENKFAKLINLKRMRNAFIDIDEDYFGVESGVKTVVERGVSVQGQENLNNLLAVLICPKSVSMEQSLNRKVQKFFSYASRLSAAQKEKNLELIKERFFELVRGNECNSKAEENENARESAIELIMSLAAKELKALAKSKYCLFTSPRLHSQEEKFGLCTGTIYPEDTLNQIHVGNNDEILKRTKKLKENLHFIFNHTTPRFFTIARSLRDGYTPRKQQRFIESALMKTLEDVLQSLGKKQKIIYDRELVFGKDGWI